MARPNALKSQNMQIFSLGTTGPKEKYSALIRGPLKSRITTRRRWTPRVHHAARRRGGVAARSARAAGRAGAANRRVNGACRKRSGLAKEFCRIYCRTAGSRLDRRTKFPLRISLCTRRQRGSPPIGGNRACCAAARCNLGCDFRCGASRGGTNAINSHRIPAQYRSCRCRIVTKTFGIVHILVAGEPAEHRLPQQTDQRRGFAMDQAIPVRTDALGSFLNRGLEEHLDADLGFGVACAVRRHYGHRELSLAKPGESWPVTDLIDGVENAIHEQARTAPTCRYDRSFGR
jgi:hypothetical protein